MTTRPFKVLGLQQIAVGAPNKDSLRALWIDILGLVPSGSYGSESENVDEDIAILGAGVARVEVDLMQPIDPDKRPRVHDPALNHVGLWVDDLHAAVDWLTAQGVRFTPGGIRKGAAGHEVCFIHPKGNAESPIGGAGVLIELVQAPADIVEAISTLAAADHIVVGQPVALDPSRAPDGNWIFWIQLQELPARIKGDAAGEIPVPANGEWNPDVKEAYLERIERRLAALIPNFESSIVGRKAYSPAELEGLNMNLVGGDPYSGACTIDQFLLWRPFPGARNHETPVKRLYHIGASTHPGPGLGGNSGFMVASKFT